jgi:hypothetical protein
MALTQDDQQGIGCWPCGHGWMLCVTHVLHWDQFRVETSLGTGNSQKTPPAQRLQTAELDVLPLWLTDNAALTL